MEAHAVAEGLLKVGGRSWAEVAGGVGGKGMGRREGGWGSTATVTPEGSVRDIDGGDVGGKEGGEKGGEKVEKVEKVGVGEEGDDGFMVVAGRKRAVEGRGRGRGAERGRGRQARRGGTIVGKKAGGRG